MYILAFLTRWTRYVLFSCFPSLRKFLSLVVCNDAAPNNDKTERIISLLSQDLFYAAYQGKKLTPKSILVPLLIKSLTNNTELITIISRLGHGVSYAKFGEVITELAYSRIDITSMEWFVYLKNVRKDVLRCWSRIT